MEEHRLNHGTLFMETNNFETTAKTFKENYSRGFEPVLHLAHWGLKPRFSKEALKVEDLCKLQRPMMCFKT